jgi:hypothetical protein
LVALLAFSLAAFDIHSQRVNLTASGLALLSLAWLIWLWRFR